MPPSFLFISCRYDFRCTLQRGDDVRHFPDRTYCDLVQQPEVVKARAAQDQPHPLFLQGSKAFDDGGPVAGQFDAFRVKVVIPAVTFSASSFSNPLRSARRLGASSFRNSDFENGSSVAGANVPEVAKAEDAIRREMKNPAARAERVAKARFDPSTGVDFLSGFPSNDSKRFRNPADRRGARRVSDVGRTDTWRPAWRSPPFHFVDIDDHIVVAVSAIVHLPMPCPGRNPERK
jgi:hypothetical protein